MESTSTREKKGSEKMKMLVGVASMAVALVFMLAVFKGEIRATLGELKTDTGQMAAEETQPQPSAQTPVVTQNRVVNPSPTRETQPVEEVQPAASPLGEQVGDVQDLNRRVETLEGTVKSYQGEPRLANWLAWWWQVGFWGGVLWMLPWVFVGTQWSRRKFWGFGWPWPWWWWMPILWWIPWVIVGWQWWLVWWPWWVWGWWIFPWIFWIFWWLVVFKEATIWVWKKQ